MFRRAIHRGLTARSGASWRPSRIRLQSLAVVTAVGATILIANWQPVRLEAHSDDRSDLLRTITLKEIKGHSRDDSGWVVIDEVVYDVTDFLAVHPGGPDVIKENLGKDITSLFHLLHSSDVLPSVADRLEVVGKLDTQDARIIPVVDEVETRRHNLPDLKFVTNLATFEKLAKEVLGEDSRAWEFISSAAEDGATLKSNRDSFSYLRFLPRINVPVGTISTATTFLGSSVTVPLLISPTGGSANAHPDGELNATIAAAQIGIPQAVSSMSSIAFSALADERDSLAKMGSRPSLWWQLYIMTDRAESERRIRNAVNHGAEAILITVDVATPGKREVAGKVFEGHGAKTGSRTGTSVISPDLFTGDLSWSDIAWVRGLAPGIPILVKGIATVQDVALAKEHGADGVVLSNHGGRQLDHAPSPLSTLVHLRLSRPDLLDERGFEVYIDGGVRRGTDVLKALCVGARGVGLGRAVLHAQACYGAVGVTRALEILTNEIEIGMKLLGAKSVSDLRPEMIELLDGLIGRPLS